MDKEQVVRWLDIGAAEGRITIGTLPTPGERQAFGMSPPLVRLHLVSPL